MNFLWLTVCHFPSFTLTAEVAVATPFPRSADISARPAASRKMAKSTRLASASRSNKPSPARVRSDKRTDKLARRRR